MQITSENFLESFLEFEDRQAGVSAIFDPGTSTFVYNVYCVDRVLLKEIFSREFEMLEDALASLSEEFGQWTLRSFSESDKGCGSCVAKK